LRLSATNDQQQIRNLILWFTADDWYLRGFTANDGTTWQFNDSDFNLLSQFNDDAQNPPTGGGSTLSFGSNYNSMQQQGANRQGLAINWTAIRGAIFGLAGYNGGGGNQALARNLLLMIQWTSEAIRFNDVYGVMNDVAANGASYPGLPYFQQRLENDWSAMSNYAYAVAQNPAAGSLTVVGANPSQGNDTAPPAGTGSTGVPLVLNTLVDIFRYLAMLNANANNVNNGGPSGDWNHAEL
jgi:hypothetical protein